MYDIEDFKRLDVFIERSKEVDCNLQGGKVVKPKVSSKIVQLLNTSGGESYDGDFSRQDSAVISALLLSGLSPADVYATFDASPRGNFAKERKTGHYEDYLSRTIRKAVGFTSSIKVDFSRKSNHHGALGLIVDMAAEVEVEKANWVWPGYIPAGKLTILSGDPGMGKSTIGIDIVSRLSRGAILPCSSRRIVTGTSLIASAEDAPADTIVPRLIASEAKLERVGMIQEVKEDETDRYLSFPQDFDLLRDILISKGCRLLIIDPLTAFIGKDSDTYKEHDMRLILHPLDKIAYETGTAILVVAHLTKKSDASPIYRIGGSIGFIAAARSVLGVSMTADKTKVLYSIKSNLSARPPSLAYETQDFRKKRKSDEWKGDREVHSSKVHWLGQVDFDPFTQTTGVGGDEIKIFFDSVFADAEILSVETICKEARTLGIAKSALNQARNTYGITLVSKDGEWFWKRTKK